MLGAALAAAALSAPPARGQALQQEKTSASATSITGTNWTTPSNIQTDDDAWAIYNNTAQDWLVVKTFGFTIPASSIIDGIEVVVQGNGAESVAGLRQFDVAVTKDGSTAAGAVVTGLQLTQTTDSDIAVSSAGASWSTTWTAADINSASFGVMIRDNDNLAHVLNFDTMTVTAHYRTIDTVTASRADVAPASIGQGADFALERMSLVTGTNTATWTAVKVTLAGTISRTDVTAVKVYLDDGDADYTNADTLLAAGTFDVSNTVILTLTPAQTITTTPQDYFVVYTLNAATPVSSTVGASIAAATDMTITSPDTMATTNFPLASSNSTVDLPDYGVTVSPSLITVGNVGLNQNYLVTTGVTVTNVGNMGTTYELKATTVTAGSPWAISTTQAADQYTMQGIFNSAQPVLGDYTASDKMLDSATLCLAGKFEGDRSCQQVRPGSARTLWLNVGMPTASTTEAVQDFQIDVTATVP